MVQRSAGTETVHTSAGLSQEQTVPISNLTALQNAEWEGSVSQAAPQRDAWPGWRRRERYSYGYRTLSDKRLARVQQDFTPFYNHPLYRQILSNIFCLTHFVVHYPKRREETVGG